jgi:hypothetical protein
MNMRAHSLRLSPTAKAKAFLPSSLLLHMRRRSSKRAGKAEGKIAFEERGDAKLHLLSPQRHMSAVGRGRNERERESKRGGRGRGMSVCCSSPPEIRWRGQ